MPLSNKEELNLIVNPDTKLNIEHSGGDGWTILHGDMLSIVKAFKPGVFDAVITDPPYASGGSKPSEKKPYYGSEVQQYESGQGIARLRRRSEGPAQLDPLVRRVAVRCSARL